MDAAVVRRIPLRHDDEDRYFPGDRFQMLPRHGYTAVIGAVLDHPNIQVSVTGQFHLRSPMLEAHTGIALTACRSTNILTSLTGRCRIARFGFTIVRQRPAAHSAHPRWSTSAIRRITRGKPTGAGCPRTRKPKPAGNASRSRNRATTRKTNWSAIIRSGRMTAATPEPTPGTRNSPMRKRNWTSHWLMRYVSVSGHAPGHHQSIASGCTWLDGRSSLSGGVPRATTRRRLSHEAADRSLPDGQRTSGAGG